MPRRTSAPPKPCLTWTGNVTGHSRNWLTGVGIFLIYALTHAGYDLVRANSIKVVVVAAFTSVALPIFVLEGQVDWLWGAVLALGFALGGLVGASVTVAGGDRLVRPMLALAVVALAGRMLGFY